MGKAVGRWSAAGGSDESAIMGYFELVMAGLAGSPHMLSCTVLAITRIIYEFKGKATLILSLDLQIRGSYFNTHRKKKKEKKIFFLLFLNLS